MASPIEMWRRWRPWWLSAIAGAVLGCLDRLILDARWSNAIMQASALMTLGFLLVVPACMGYISVFTYLRTAPEEKSRWYYWFFLPWVSVSITMAISIAVSWEGAPCLIFAAPMVLIGAILGGLVARAFWRRMKKRAPGTLAAFATPLLVALLEVHVATIPEVRIVETDIAIHAPASVVWNNIQRVHAIAPSELQNAWINRIGFLKPVEATLSHQGIGGVRKASFTGGLVFTETIDRWDSESDLRFSIHANTDTIPPSTLDQHVSIGGAFFDVLQGEYRLEPSSNGVLLRLISRERISTHFNAYAGVWTDAVMRSIQNQILQVIRIRCESAADTPQ